MTRVGHDMQIRTHVRTLRTRCRFSNRISQKFEREISVGLKLQTWHKPRNFAREDANKINYTKTRSGKKIILSAAISMRNMGSTVRLIIAIFVLAGSYASCEMADPNKYVQLISDLRNQYSLSAVFFIFSRTNPPMQEYTMAHSLTRTFSKQYVFTLTTHLGHLNKHLEYHRKRTNRPLAVILLESLGAIDKFNENVQEINKSYPIWLVIFNGSPSDPSCEYCRRPVGNVFGLRLNTLMLVLCCDNPMLEEWWSVDGNSTEISVFGSWTANEPLKVLTTQGLSARRHDVNGTGLRVVVVKNSTLVKINGNRVDGFLGTVLLELRLAMNFTITELHLVEVFGNYDPNTKNWSGAIGMIVRGEADIAVSDFGILESRLGAIDFTDPLYLTQTKLFLRTPDSIGDRWSAYFEAFASEIWVALIVLLITTPLLLTFIKVKQGLKQLGALYFECYLSLWGIFCQQGLFESPVGTPMRIAYFSIFSLALVLSAAYSAELTSFITVASSAIPFSDMAGFVRDGTYKLLVYQNSSDYHSFNSTSDTTFKKMGMLMKPWQQLPVNARQAFDQVCSEKVALLTTTMQRRTTAVTCNIVGVETGRLVSFALALTRGSQYTNAVNYHLGRFKANGMFARLRTMYYSTDDPVVTTYDIVEFSRVMPILLILVIGVIVAVVLLTIELLHSYGHRGHWCSRKNESPETRWYRLLEIGKRVGSWTRNQRLRRAGGGGDGERRATITLKNSDVTLIGQFKHNIKPSTYVGGVKPLS